MNLIQSFVSLIHNILKKSYEHLTVMLIPHSEKRIFTLHISYLTLFFIGIILAIVIIISSINILSTSTTQQEVHNLIQLSKSWKIKEKILQKGINVLNENIAQLKPEIEKLYASTSDKKNYINLYAIGGSSDLNSDVLEDIKTDKLPDEYYYLEQIKRDIILSKKYIEHVGNFIKEREKIFSKIPSIWPLKVGGHITSAYGQRPNPFRRGRSEWHKGIDIASWPGAPIVASAEGLVIFTGFHQGYGLTVIVQHDYGFQTYYAHLSRIKTYLNKTVKRGEIIGFLGKTGLATGYHLHYEVRIGLTDVNPWLYIMNIK